MAARKKVMLASVAAFLLAAVSASAGHGIDPNGVLDTVEVVAEVPEHLSGMMPEVAVAERGPTMVLDEVVSIAEGPRRMLDEVPVVAEAPEREHAFRIVLHDLEFTLERIN